MFSTSTKVPASELAVILRMQQTKLSLWGKVSKANVKDLSNNRETILEILFEKVTFFFDTLY